MCIYIYIYIYTHVALLYKIIFYLPKMCYLPGIDVNASFKYTITHLYLKPVSNQTIISKERALFTYTALNKRPLNILFRWCDVGIIHVRILHKLNCHGNWTELTLIWTMHYMWSISGSLGRPLAGPSWFRLVWEGRHGSMASLHASVGSLKAFSWNFKWTVWHIKS